MRNPELIEQREKAPRVPDCRNHSGRVSQQGPTPSEKGQQFGPSLEPGAKNQPRELPGRRKRRSRCEQATLVEAEGSGPRHHPALTRRLPSVPICKAIEDHNAMAGPRRRSRERPSRYRHN
jgi:hypothetical protein